MSFFFNAHSDFFEEIAKYRAARRIWARVMRDRFGAQERPLVEAAIPHSDRRRVADRAAAVQQRRAHGIAGALGRPGRHELPAHQLPGRGAGAADRTRGDARAAHAADHRQESGVTEVVDPLGGSYFVERLTREWKTGRFAYFDRIDAMGGMVPAIEQGFPQREIGESAYRFQQAVEQGDKIIVGVNDFVEENETPLETLYVDESVAVQQVARLERVKSTRNGQAVRSALDALRTAASGQTNLLPLLLDAVRAYATLGEMCDALRSVWGEYRRDPHDLIVGIAEFRIQI